MQLWEVEQHLCKLYARLHPYMWVANTHGIQILTEFEKLNPEWMQQLLHCFDHEEEDFLLKIAGGRVKETSLPEGELRQLLVDLCEMSLSRNQDPMFQAYSVEEMEALRLRYCCGEKKKHEVETMAIYLKNRLAGLGIDCAIEFGSGKGYLCDALSLGCGLKTVGIDASAAKIKSAQKRGKFLSKEWNGKKKMRNRATSLLLQADVDDDGVDNIDDVVRRDGTVLITGFVTPESASSGKLGALIEEESRGLIKRSDSVAIVGLHACGDLTSSVLRIFSSWAQAKVVVIVGCCLNLATEEFDPEEERVEMVARDSHAHADVSVPALGAEIDGGSKELLKGFPLSQALKGMNAVIGRNARMESMQATERLIAKNGVESSGIANFFRAILHVLLIEQFSNVQMNRKRTRIKLEVKTATLEQFIIYGRFVISKMGYADVVVVSDEMFAHYFELYAPKRREFEAYMALKTALCSCIESIFVMDRVCYLLEQSSLIQEAGYYPMFDPILSPRNMAIYAIKK